MCFTFKCSDVNYQVDFDCGNIAEMKRYWTWIAADCLSRYCSTLIVVVSGDYNQEVAEYIDIVADEYYNYVNRMPVQQLFVNQIREHCY